MGNEMKITKTCRRCNGTGNYTRTRICWGCNGTGTPPIRMTEEEWAANDARRAVTEEAHKARKAIRRAAYKAARVAS
jgi:DnaJ-class molecular chaperone